MTRGMAALAMYAMETCGFATSVAAQTKCTNCEVVRLIRAVEQKGEGSGVGVVEGGVLSGVLGHQIGSGRGNTVATIEGDSAYGWNQVKKTTWSVAIRMDAGQARTFNYSNQPTVREGERVKLIDSGKRLALVANQAQGRTCWNWRRRRDSNPGYRFWPVCSLSRGVPSTTRPRLREPRILPAVAGRVHRKF